MLVVVYYYHFSEAGVLGERENLIWKNTIMTNVTNPK